jgi:hypothetical protein
MIMIRAMYRMVTAFLVVLGLLVLLCAPGTVQAKDVGKRKVIRLEAIKVEGRIRKPQAFYFLQRSNLNFEALELRQSFIPKIIDSIEGTPF